jgi:hypothetical protein
MYAWLVTLHLLGLVVFLVCHAVSMWVAFRVRGEPDRAVIAALLGLSARGNQVMYLGLLMLAIGGLGAAWSAGLLLAPWVIASYVILVVTFIGMYALGAGFYYPLREGLEGTEKTPRLDDDGVRAVLAGSRRPEALALVGLTSLALLVAVMTLKPS